MSSSLSLCFKRTNDIISFILSTIIISSYHLPSHLILYSEGYKLLLSHNNPTIKEKMEEMETKIENYKNELSELGIRDYQVFIK